VATILANNRKDLRTELRTMKFEFDLLQRIPCSEEENRAFKRYLEDGQDLPQGVFRYRNSDGKNSDSEFYTVYDPDLTEREMNEFLKMRQMQILKSIKGAIMLFGTAISVLLLIIMIFMLAGR
jgi:hypothetical protein